MSSEISTDAAATPPPARPGDAGLQPWQLFMLAGLLGASAVVLVAGRQSPAGVVLLSLTIFTAAAVGVAAWRMLAPLAVGEQRSAPRIIAGRTRAALEREKTLVLRSIKELEFDHSMGKVSDRDFADMQVRLRTRAAGLLRQLDAGTGYREEIEREVARRVESTPPPDVPPAAVLPACASCGTTIEPDARFCKHCGARVAEG